MTEQKTLKCRGDRVWCWWDTGAMGSNPLHGVVVASGPRAYVVEWESGARNRIRQGDTNCHHLDAGRLWEETR